MQLRRATVADAVALSVFARRVFADTFAADNDPTDMAVYLDLAFSPERQGEALAAADRVCLLAEERGETVGYALLRDHRVHVDVQAAHPVELERFYVDHAWHGRGVAAMLMTESVTIARDMGGDVLWLGVWERNARAIRFYEKQGFKDVGTQTFVLGADVQTDCVMAKPLT